MLVVRAIWRFLHRVVNKDIYLLQTSRVHTVEMQWGKHFEIENTNILNSKTRARVNEDIYRNTKALLKTGLTNYDCSLGVAPF